MIAAFGTTSRGCGTRADLPCARRAPRRGRLEGRKCRGVPRPLARRGEDRRDEARGGRQPQAVSNPARLDTAGSGKATGMSALTTFPPWFLKTYPPLPPRREVVNFAQRFLDCPV